MRLPYIKLEYREEESYALGKVSAPLIVGFALYWCWMYLSFCNGAVFLYPDAENLAQPMLIAMSICFAVVLMCYGVLLEPVRSLFSTNAKRNRNRLLASIAATLGMLIQIVAGVLPAAQLPLALVGALLIGFGAAVLVISYGVSFSVCDLPTIAVCTAIALPFSAVFFEFMLYLDSVVHLAATIICLALPFAQLLCLRRCSANLVDKLEFKALTIPVRILPFAFHIFLPSLVFGVLIGMLRTWTVIAPLGGGFHVDTALAVLLACLFVFVALMLAMYTQRQSDNFEFRTLMPLAAVLLALLVIPDIGESPISTFLLFAVYLILESCLWILQADVSQRYRISAFVVFGFGRAALALGVMVGYLISDAGSPGVSVVPGSPAFLAIAFVVCALGVSLLPTHRELRHVLKRGQRCPGFISSGYERHVGDDADTMSDKIEAPAPVAAAVAMPAAASETADTGTAADVRADAAPERESANDADNTHKAGRFKRKCAAIADCYLLSRREAEVLFLLAKGHNSTTIQENLFISEGTANTHMRNIYRKLDVHSQQDLMNMVEAVDMDYDVFPGEPVGKDTRKR